MTTKTASLEGAAIGLIVLEAMIEKSKPLLDTVSCFGPPKYPVYRYDENQGKTLWFCGRKAEMMTKNGSFGGSTSG